MTATYLGIDLGGTTAKLARVTPAGTIEDRRTLVTADYPSAASLLDALAANCLDLARAAPHATDPIHVGIGLPGLIARADQRVLKLPNIDDWQGTYPAREFAARTGFHVTLDNDANVAALGERAFGAARDTPSFLLCALGTGVGGAVVLDNTLWRGATGLAGELGHIKVAKTGPRCGCGAIGCVETFVGGRYLADIAQQLYESGYLHPHELGVDDATPLTALTAQHLAAAARRSNPRAREAWRVAGRALGAALSNTILLLDIETIVFVGGGANALDLLEPEARATLRETLFARDADAIRFVAGTLGEDAGVIGAAVLAMQATAQLTTQAIAQPITQPTS